MSSGFSFRRLDRKVGCWVELDIPYDSTELAYHYYMNQTEDAMAEIDRWVVQNNLGRRQAFALWQLNDEKALTMFLLKWE